MSVPSRLPEPVVNLLPHLSIEKPIWLVGGGVRDLLMNQSTADYDFVIDGEVVNFARQLADRMGGNYYDLDKVRGIGRVILEETGGIQRTLDFARMRGPDIEADLKARDFTINALAVNLENPERLLDPTGGVKDLNAKVLRACSSNAMENDPVRALRAVRLSVVHGLQIEPGTLRQVKQAASSLVHVSPERVRDELLRILDTLHPGPAIRLLDRLALLPVVFPELANLKDLELPVPHTFTALEHTLNVVDRLGDLLAALMPDNGPQVISDPILDKASSSLDRFQEAMQAHLNTAVSYGRRARQLLFFAALYHDVCRPFAESSSEDGKIPDDDIGIILADLVGTRAVYLRLSNAEIQRLRNIVSFDFCPDGLERLMPVTPRAIYHFFRKAGDTGVEVVLLSLADVLGTYDRSRVPREKWEGGLSAAQALLGAYFEDREKMIDPPLMIRGGELIQNLGIEQGPEVGRLLEIIREAQAVGEVSTPEEALTLARTAAKVVADND